MPSFKPFGGIAGRPAASLFEIRLDNDTVVLRGVQGEASSQLLRGTIVLCLPAALELESVRLRMTGQLKIGRVLLPETVGTKLTVCRWNDRVAGAWNPSRWVEKSTEIFHHSWPPFVGSGDTGSVTKAILLPPGNYEWPFDLVVDGSMPETIEGLTNSYIVYKLEATITRGKAACDLHAHKPVRIVRTLGPASLELAHPMTMEYLWADKIECQMSIPQKAVAFGTEITIEMKLTPLLKGLTIGTVQCVLLEYQEFTLREAVAPSLLREREVDSWAFAANDEDDMLDEHSPDGFTLERVLLLPKRLTKCVPDADACGIKVRHRVRVGLDIYNPDGHISEFRTTLPITIFISPDMLPDSNGCVHVTGQRLQLDSLYAPPPYRAHILDRPYMHQPLGVASVPQSRATTPISSWLRSLSSDNLALPYDIVHVGGIRPTDLSESLQDLRSRKFSSLFRGGNEIRALFKHGGSYNVHTTRGNPAEAVAHYDLNDMNSVPPYSEAICAPIPPANYHEPVPSYETAVAAPIDQAGALS